jgi:hypothetical protein
MATNGNGVLTRTAFIAMGTMTLLGSAGLVGYKVARAEEEMRRAEVVELRKSIDLLNSRLDQFNQRLSWLEGATSGAVSPETKR